MHPAPHPFSSAALYRPVTFWCSITAAEVDRMILGSGAPLEKVVEHEAMNLRASCTRILHQPQHNSW